MTIRYPRSAERPDLRIWWFDDDRTLIDLSGPYTFQAKLGDTGNPAVLTKTAGITGAAGTGEAPTGTPNLTIAWTAGELDLTPGRYTLQVTATTSGTDRVATHPFEIVDIIT